MKKVVMKVMLTASLAMGMVVSNAAFAHAHLVTMAPAAESNLSVSPIILDLRFSEGVESSLSHVVLTDSKKKKIKIGKFAVVDKERKHVQIAVGSTLKPGKYEVEWRVVSVDGHKTHGKWTFEVSPAATK